MIRLYRTPTRSISLRCEHRLRPEDVADAGDDGLIQKQPSDGAAAASDALDGPPRVGVLAERILAETSCDPVASCRVEHLARRRAVEVDRPRVADHPHPHGTAWLRRRGRLATVLAVQPEVDVQDPIALPPVEEVLPVGLDAIEALSVQSPRSITESPLRRAHAQALANDVARLITGESMDGVAFGHGAVSARRDDRPWTLR